MKTFACVLMSVPLLALLGCQDAVPKRPRAQAMESVSYVTTDELSAAVAEEGGVVLVEFCVPTGCARCDQMRQQIDQLASDEQDGLTIRRIDLNQQPGLVWELGVKVCPSYIAFRDGKEVFRAEYPTSSDLIAAQLDRVLQTTEPQQLASQSVH